MLGAMDVVAFQKLLRETGGYVSPSSRRPPARAGALSAWRFYLSTILPIVWVGARQSRQGVFDDAAWSALGFRMIAGAERLGGTVTCEGFGPWRDLPPARVYVANHMSLFETIALPAMLLAYGPLTIVVKESLLHYPLFGIPMRATRPIAVTRRDARRDLQTVLTEGEARLRAGGSVLLFPQATRAAAFDPRLFNSLGAKLADRAGVPLLPVAVRTDFAGIGTWMKDFGPVDPARPVRFAAGPVLLPDRPARERHRETLAFLSRTLSGWGLPVAAAEGSMGDAAGTEPGPPDRGPASAGGPASVPAG